MNKFRNMLTAALAAFVCGAGCTGPAVGEGEYLIEGKVKGIPENTEIELYASDGRLLSVAATDTVRSGLQGN